MITFKFTAPPAPIESTDPAEEQGPTAAELAAIEYEMPLIEAEIAVLDAEIGILRAPRGATALDRRRLRRAQHRALRTAAALACPMPRLLRSVRHDHAHRHQTRHDPLPHRRPHRGGQGTDPGAPVGNRDPPRPGRGVLPGDHVATDATGPDYPYVWVNRHTILTRRHTRPAAS